MISLLRTRFIPSFLTPAIRTFSTSPAPKIVPLEPGLLTIKHGLSREEQITLSNIALQAGETGFWRTDPQGNRVLNSAPHRGRIYQAVKSYPPIVGNLCRRSIELAAKTDTTIKVVDATHLILLYYKMKPSAESSKEQVVFRKELSKNIQSVFREEGVSERDLYLCNTAFTQTRLEQLLQEKGADILHMSKISAATDEGHPIHEMGTIFKKKYS